MFRALIERVSQQVPARCAICHAWPSRVVCNACVTRFAQPVPRCTTCALPVPEGVTRCGACLREPPPLDACLAAVNYAWPWSDCVTRFKFGNQPGWAAELATVMRSAPWVEPALEQSDRVLPMPLARERLAERGYNQALLLARHFAPRKTDATLLLRTRHTPAQSELTRAERLRTICDAVLAQWRGSDPQTGQPGEKLVHPGSGAERYKIILVEQCRARSHKTHLASEYAPQLR